MNNFDPNVRLEDLFLPKRNINITCPFLNENGCCDIYHARPLMCREYGRIKSCYCDLLPTDSLIDINEFSDNNRIKNMLAPNGSWQKPYPIIDWLGTMTEKILISEKYRKSYSVDKIKFYY